MINITLPDGRVNAVESGTTPLDIARTISEGLARNVLAAEVNGEIRDAFRPLTADAKLRLLTWDDAAGQSTFWHSSAHLLAEALEVLYPGVKFGIGPPIAGGFYYDIDLGDTVLRDEDLPALESKMKELAKTKNTYRRREVSKAEALDFFGNKGDEYKLELIQDLQDGQITFYEQGNFTDLCRGPHIPDTGFIKAVKILSIAGAYWRGDEKRKQLTRIYGVSFPKQSQLDEHLALLEEARKRDHRKLGQELGLFMFSQKVGAGLPLWLPKGTIVRGLLEDYLKKEQLKRGYTPVVTPHIGKKELYVTSGHYEKYGADSFQPIRTPREDEEFLLKPMNCPHHCEIFKNKPVSYKDLPVRIAEFGTVYRYEQSGELHGLTRVRGFTQDDAHIFCTKEQVKAEFMDVIDLTLMVLRKLGFDDYTAQISVRDPATPEKYIGDPANWERAEQEIKEAADEKGLITTVVEGEAAFYGPKLDFMVKDALKRSWQLGTIQVDYNLPERFELEYIGSDNQRHRPVMIHRAPFGSFERFLGVLIEHLAGNFPLWLAPDQVAVLPISDKYIGYAAEVNGFLKQRGFRSFADDRSEKIGKKIRDSELLKVPYMLVVGEKEAASRELSVRRHGEGDLGSLNWESFAERLESEVLQGH